MTIQLVSSYTLSFFCALINAQKKIYRNEILVSIKSPTIKCDPIAIIIAANIHLINIAHRLDITDNQLC